MSKEFNITLLPGDGTGPEVVNEAVKVLENTSEQYKIKFNFTNNDLGGDRYLNTGELVTEKDIEQFKNSDAVLLGAIGHPDVKPGILEQGILLKLRKEFDQYINLRPVVLYPGVETPQLTNLQKILTLSLLEKIQKDYMQVQEATFILEQKMKLQHKNPLIRIMQYIDV